MFVIPKRHADIDRKMPFYVSKKSDTVYVMLENGKLGRIKRDPAKEPAIDFNPNEHIRLNLARPSMFAEKLNRVETIVSDITLINDIKQRIFEAIRFLDVEHNPIYKPEKKATFCNIYAYHLLSLCGIWIPRIFWQNESDLFFKSSNLYANCYELNANGITDFLIKNAENPIYQYEFIAEKVGKTNHSIPAKESVIFDFEKVQNLGIISAYNNNGSGHIAVLFRDQNGKLCASQAGRTNIAYDYNFKKWFLSGKYSKRILLNCKI